MMAEKKKKKSLIKSIREFLRSIFGKVHQEFFVRTEPDVVKQTELALRRENAELWATVKKQAEKIRKLEAALKKFKEEYEVEIVEEAKLQEKVIRRIRKENRYAFIFKGKKFPILVSVIRHKYFRDGNGSAYKYWRGIEIEDTKKGPVINLLVSKTPNDKVLGRIEGPPFQYFPYLFTDIYGLVQDLKTGIVTVNIAPDGTFIPPSLPTSDDEEEREGEEKLNKLKEEVEEEKTPSKSFKKKAKRAAYIDLAHILKTKDPEVIDAILSLYKRLSRAEGEKLRAMEREKEALLESIEAKVVAQSKKKALDRATAFTQMFFEKLENAYSKLQETKVKEIDARLKQTLTEMVIQTLWGVIDEILARRVPKISKEDREIIRREIKEDVEMAARNILQILMRKQAEEGGAAG